MRVDCRRLLGVVMAEHADIWAAIAAAQAEIQQPARLGKGAFSRKDEKTGKEVKAKYLTLADLLEASKIYSNHGLAIARRMVMVDKQLVFGCALRMGNQVTDWCEFPVVPEGNTAQKWGSALTYAQRYATGALLGIAGEDDDGQAASEPTKAEPRPAPKPDPRPEASEPAPKPVDAQLNSQLDPWWVTDARIAVRLGWGDETDKATVEEWVKSFVHQTTRPSGSGGAEHKVARAKDGIWRCDCKGYQTRKTCSHTIFAELAHRAQVLGDKYQFDAGLVAKMDPTELLGELIKTEEIRKTVAPTAGAWEWSGRGTK